MPTSPLTTPLGRRLPTITLGLAALLLAACGQSPNGEPDPSPATEPPSPDETTDSTTDPTAAHGAADRDVADMEFTSCQTERYTVSYPAEWNTNADSDLLGACEIFHPDNIDISERARDRDLHDAVSLYVDEADFDDLRTGDDPNEVIEERGTTIDGHRALVAEYRSTGEALTPEGEHSYTWTIDLDGEILVATTSSVGETDYERDKRVLDRMVTEELTIHDETADETPDETPPIDVSATTERSTEEPDGWSLVVTDVRIGAHGSFDRVVFEITGDGEAGWLIEYEDDPRSQGRGNPVEIEGDAVLRVALRHIAYPTDAPVEPYDGPERIAPERTDAIIEVLEDVLYEGYQDFFIGLDAERPYRVKRLFDPQRVVIDIETD